MSFTINADDFGKDHETNMAICEAFEKGLIDRTTLMSNMDAAEEAMKLAFEKGFLEKVGIHLNLTQGMPITDGLKSNKEMCNDEGCFTADFHRNTFKRFFLSQKTRKDITGELDAQVSRFFELGGKLCHIDSHHHVHTDASVLCALEPVLNKYDITSIRLGRNLYNGGNPLMRLYKTWLNNKLNDINTDEIHYFGSVKDFENYDADSEFVANNEIEIMVHPMYVDGELYDTDYPMSEMRMRLGGGFEE